MSDETLVGITAAPVRLRLKPERLHPDLKKHLGKGPFGRCLSHPLVQEWSINPKYAASANFTYQHKLAKLDEARRRCDWDNYVFLHERSHRFDAFMGIRNSISRSQAYWELVSSVWIDSENVIGHDEDWYWLWNDGRPNKRFAMNADERKAFKKLPDELTIYRGIREGGNVYGLSWTLDRNIGIWFARRDGSDVRPLLTARAKKSDVHALLLGREEREIVINEFETIATEYVSANAE